MTSAAQDRSVQACHKASAAPEGGPVSAGSGSPSSAEQVRYVGVNPDRAACESSPYPHFARDDYDRGHEFCVMMDGRYHCRFCGVDENYWRSTKAVAV